MKVLVTGGAGFMGKTIVNDLLEHGHSVRVLDKNTESLTGVKNERLEFVTGGIEDVLKVKEAVAGCEIIYHLAETFSSNPYEVLEIDIKGNLNLLQEAKAQKVQQYLFASTHRVYGRPRYQPIDEEHSLHAEESGRAVYAAAKLMGEKLCLTYWKEQELPVTVFRFWWAFSREIGGRVLRNMIDAALKGETLRVPERAGGNFLYNEDAALAMQLATEDCASYGEVFNISSGTYTTWQELAETVIELTGGKSALEFITQDEDVNKTMISSDRSIAYECNLDISKADSLIGFKPLYPSQKVKSLLREALSRLVEARRKR
jgi:UDP-glucose 4-epimerase